jgi:hypothetical protein
VALAAPAWGDPFADRVAAVTVGAGGGGGDLAWVLGPPDGRGAFAGSHDTFSLGLGGSITLEFTDNLIVDGPGVDFTVFENAFLLAGEVTYPPFAEPATVSVSDDGITFATFPCAADASPYYPGCAGVYPVFATRDDPASALVPSTTPIEALVGLAFEGFVPPAGSGGDGFDLAEVGLTQARFVRIDGGGARFGLDGLAGFDLDAVAAVHSLDLVGDRDDDGIPDADDPCPDDASCRPMLDAVFAGGGRGRAERLLTYAAPASRVIRVPVDETRTTFEVVVAAGVDPATVRLTVDGRDATPSLGAVRPGTTKMVGIPLRGARTAVRLRAAGAHGRRDVDRFVIRKEEPSS